MITQMRKSLKSRWFKAVLWITLGLLILPVSIGELYKMIFSSSSWIISVNGTKISAEAIAQRVREQEQKIKEVYEQYPDYAQMVLQIMGLNRDLRELAVDSLVQESLLDHAATTVRLPVSEQAIADLVGGNLDQLKAYARQMHISYDDLEKQIKGQLQRAQLMNIVRSSAYVPEYVLQNAYRSNYLGKKFALVSLPLQDFIKKEEAKEINFAELQAYFDMQNKKSKRYFIPEKRSGTAWKFDPASYGISISPEEISRYYESHKEDYKDKPIQVQVRRIVLKATAENERAVQEKAQKLQEELSKDPSLFAKKAQELSEDVESAKQGGLMPFFSQGTHEKAFERAAFLLQKDGAVSNVFRTEKGFEIVQRQSKKAATFKPLSSVENDIKNMLAQKKFNAQFVSDAKAVIEKSKTDASALAEFATQKKAKKQIVSHAPANATAISQALFRMSEGGYTSFIDGDLGVIVNISSIEKAYVPEFKSMEDAAKEDLKKVKADFIQERAAKAFEAALLEAQKKAQTQGKGLALDAYTALFNGRVEQTGLIKPTDSEAIKKLTDRGISVRDLLQLEKPGSVIASKGKENGYIIRLEAVEPFKEAEFQAHKAEVKESILQQESAMVFEGFVASLYRNATIKQK